MPEAGGVTVADLTIVIPTKDRPRFLGLVLTYYARQRCPFPILIGDASAAHAYEENRRIVEVYRDRLNIGHERHAPHISGHASIVQLLEKVATRYAAFSGDDDFLVPDHLRRGVDFLEAHPDYAMAGGTAAWVYVTGWPGDGLTVNEVTSGSFPTIDADAPSRRIVTWAYPRRGINSFSVQRTEQMRFGWQQAARLGLDSADRVDSPLYEVCFNVLSLIQGKQAKLPGLYLVMLRHTHKRPGVNAFDRLAGWRWPSQVAGLVACWAEEIVKREAIEYERAHDLAKATFLSWLLPYITRYRDNRLRENGLLKQPALAGRTAREVVGLVPGVAKVARLVRRAVSHDEELSLAGILDPRSAYHRNFVPIYELLTTGVPAELAGVAGRPA